MTSTSTNHYDLSFTSKDLTDNYQDDQTTQTSISSSTNNRHPLGDSPLKRSHFDHSAISDRGLAGSTTTTTGGRGNGINLEKLLDFLDDEVDEAEEGGEEYNSARDEGDSKRYDSSTREYPLQQSLPSSSTPPLPHQNNNNNNNHFPSSSSNHRPNNSPFRTTDMNIEPTTSLFPSDHPSARKERSRSPSPLPRSIPNGKGKERDNNKTGTVEGGAGGGRDEGRKLSSMGLTPEVLNEFSEIVSPRNSSDSEINGRPRSRLRKVPSPNPPTTTSNGGENDILIELREAKDYIRHLQLEMSRINTVVKELKGSSSSFSTTPASSTPFLPTSETSTTAAKDTLELAKHLFALLPPSSNLVSPLPSLHSIILALEFTRSIDSLVHSTIHTNERRDEEIFKEDNLGNLWRSLEGWERRSG